MDEDKVQEPTACAATPSTPTAATAVPAPEAAQPQTPANPAPTAPTQVKGDKPPRPKMSEVERIASWRDRLLTAGYSPKSTDLIIEYAKKATTFELDQHGQPRPGGGLLVIMFTRLATRLKDAPSVSADDVLDANAGLLEYFQQKPLGATVEEWRTKYATNGLQRQAIDAFFNFTGKRVHELESGPRFLFSIRDAAWPSRKEEAAGIGGTFAERFILFSKAICRIFMTSGDEIEKFFDSFYHEEEVKLPDWIDMGQDGVGHCKTCGAEITTDKNGNYICSNDLCDHNIAPAGSALPESFLSGSANRPQKVFSSPDKPPRRGNNRSEDREDDFQPRKKFKKSGPRYRERDVDDGGVGASDGTERVVHVGDQFPANTIAGAVGSALDGLNLQ